MLLLFALLLLLPALLLLLLALLLLLLLTLLLLLLTLLLLLLALLLSWLALLLLLLALLHFFSLLDVPLFVRFFVFVWRPEFALPLAFFRPSELASLEPLRAASTNLMSKKRVNFNLLKPDE